MRWNRARKIARRGQLDYLEAMYRESVPNYGYRIGGPKRAGSRRFCEVLAPHILAQEPADTCLWPALFKAWPNWHWGMQSTGNCTAWMQGHILDTLLALFWVAGKKELPEARVSKDSIYALAKCELSNDYGWHGAGSNGIDVASASQKLGFLLMKTYQVGGKTYDLTEEDAYAKAWGDAGQGLPDALEPIAKEHTAGDRIDVLDTETAGKLIQSGYPVQYCGYSYWPHQRDDNGIGIGRYSSGWHAMSLTGVRWGEDGRPAYFWNANTGHGDHVDGPVGPYPVPDRYAECGAWIPADKYVAPVLRAGDCYAHSAINGWPILNLETLGFGGGKWL